MPKPSTAFSTVDTAVSYSYRRTGGWRLRDACPRYRSTALPSCNSVGLVLSSSLMTQLAFRRQPRLLLDELPFIEKQLQQLVERQE